MALHFSIELIDEELIAEINPLISIHNDEMETKIKDVKWPQYMAMQEVGLYKLYTVRDEGELVGYCGFIVMPSHHHAGTMAMQDAIFVKRSHRKGMLGYKFLKHCVNEIEKLGVNATNLATSCSPDLSKIYLRLGFSLIEKTFRKEYGT